MTEVLVKINNKPTYFYLPLKRPIKGDYLTFNAKKVFNLLQNIFILIPISYLFDLKCHLFMKINTFSFIICIILN